MTIIKQTLVSICPEGEGVVGVAVVSTIDQIHPLTGKRLFETQVYGVDKYLEKTKAKFHERAALVDAGIEENHTDLIRHDVIVNKLLAGEYDYDMTLGDPDNFEPSTINIYGLTERDIGACGWCGKELPHTGEDDSKTRWIMFSGYFCSKECAKKFTSHTKAIRHIRRGE